MAHATKKRHGIVVKFSGMDYKFEEDKKYAVYNLLVTKEGTTWSLQKRFSDFFFLHQNLDKKLYGGMKAQFPHKQFKQLTTEDMEHREVVLKEWFAEFLETPITPRVLDQVYSYLRVLEHTAEVHQNSLRKFPGSIIKTGYLTKLGGNKAGSSGNWKRRFMVLSDDLVYYDSEEMYQNGAQPKGVVSMNCFFAPNPPENAENEFTLFALPYEFTCRADTKEEMIEWITIFQNIQTIG